MVTAIRPNTGSFHLVQLNEEMKTFSETENYGNEYQLAGMSVNEKKAVPILDDGTRKLDEGYEVPTTWKAGPDQ